jgi:hypothetical protein
MTNEKVQAKAAQLGASQYVQWLIDKGGPFLAELLLDVMMKRAEPGIKQRLHADSPATTAAGLDMSLLITTLLERFGPQLLSSMADQLETRADTGSRLAAAILRIAGPQLVTLVTNLLRTPEGAAAMAQVVQQTQDGPPPAKAPEAAAAGSQVDTAGLLIAIMDLFSRLLGLFRSQPGQQALMAALTAHYDSVEAGR